MLGFLEVFAFILNALNFLTGASLRLPSSGESNDLLFLESLRSFLDNGAYEFKRAFFLYADILAEFNSGSKANDTGYNMDCDNDYSTGINKDHSIGINKGWITSKAYDTGHSISKYLNFRTVSSLDIHKLLLVSFIFLFSFYISFGTVGGAGNTSNCEDQCSYSTQSIGFSISNIRRKRAVNYKESYALPLRIFATFVFYFLIEGNYKRSLLIATEAFYSLPFLQRIQQLIAFSRFLNIPVIILSLGAAHLASLVYRISRVIFFVLLSLRIKGFLLPVNSENKRGIIYSTGDIANSNQNVGKDIVGHCANADNITIDNQKMSDAYNISETTVTKENNVNGIAIGNQKINDAYRDLRPMGDISLLFTNEPGYQPPNVPCVSSRFFPAFSFNASDAFDHPVVAYLLLFFLNLAIFLVFSKILRALENFVVSVFLSAVGCFSLILHFLIFPRLRENIKLFFLTVIFEGKIDFFGNPVFCTWAVLFIYNLKLRYSGRYF